MVDSWAGSGQGIMHSAASSEIFPSLGALLVKILLGRLRGRLKENNARIRSKPLCSDCAKRTNKVYESSNIGARGGESHPSGDELWPATTDRDRLRPSPVLWSDRVLPMQTRIMILRCFH